MFERSRRRDAINLVDSRHVNKFKLINGMKVIKARQTGYTNFDEILETLNMLKPGLGTKGAPWAWVPS